MLRQLGAGARCWWEVTGIHTGPAPSSRCVSPCRRGRVTVRVRWGAQRVGGGAAPKARQGPTQARSTSPPPLPALSRRPRAARCAPRRAARVVRAGPCRGLWAPLGRLRVCVARGAAPTGLPRRLWAAQYSTRRRGRLYCFDGCGRASLCHLNAAKVTLVRRLDSAPRGRLVATARRAAEGRAARRTGRRRPKLAQILFFFVTNLVLS